MKVEACDYHGVADAAMDIREIEAKLKVYEDMRKMQGAELLKDPNMPQVSRAYNRDVDKGASPSGGQNFISNSEIDWGKDR